MSLGEAFIDAKADTKGFLPDLKTKLTALLRTYEAKVKVTPDLRGFRAAVAAATKVAPVKVAILPTGIPAFRAALVAGLGNSAVKVQIVPGNLVEFRRLIRTALLAERFTIRITPVIRGLGGRNPFDPLHRAGKSTATQLEKVFDLMAQRIRRTFLDLPGDITKALVAIGAIGEAIFIGVGVAGVSLASKIELLNISLENLAESTKGTERPLLSAGQSFEDLRDDIVSFAKASPLGVNAVNDAIIRLTSSLKVSGDQALNQVDTITSALAITPGSLNAEGLGGVVRALTQIASAGKLGGQELLQLSNQIPILARSDIKLNIAEQLGLIPDASKVAKKDLKGVLEEVTKLQEAGKVGANTALQAVFDSLSKTPGAEKALELFNNSFTGTLERIKETLEFDVGSLFLPILKTVADGLEGLADLIPGALEDSGFIDAFTKQFGEVVKIFTASLPGILAAIVAIGEAFTSIFKAVGPDGFAAIGETIAKVFSGIGPVIDFVKKAIETIAPIVSGIISAIVDAAPSFKPFIDAVVKLAVAFGGFLKDVGGPILKILGKALSSLAPIIELIAFALAVVGKVLGSILGNSVVQKILAFGASFVLLGGAIVKVGAFMGRLAARISGTLIPIVGRFLPLLVRLFNNFTPLGAIISRVMGTVISILGRLAGVARTVFGGITRILKRILVPIAAIGIAFRDVGEFIKDSMVKAFDIVLLAMEKIFELAGKLPFIGDKFDGLADRVRNFRAELNAIPTEKNVTIRLRVITEEFKQKAANVPGAFAGNDTLNGPTPFITPEQAAKVKRENRRAAKDFGLDAFKNLGGTSTTGGGGGAAAKAADTAADRAKQILEKFRDKIREFLRELNDDFTKGLIADDSKGIRTTLRKLAEDIADAFEEAGKPRPSKILSRISKDNKALGKLARERAKVLRQLEDAVTRAAAASDSARSFADITSLDFEKAAEGAAAAVAQLNIATLDIAGSFQVVSRETTKAAEAVEEAFKPAGRDIARQLKARLNALREFQADIDKLIKRGFNKSLIDQIISAGVDGGAETADALANASNSVKNSINRTQKAIDKAATELGNTAAENLFRSGGQVVDGLIAGLKDRKSEIVKEMTSIAESLIKAIRKALKIASPSKRAAGEMGHVVSGMVQGLRGGHGEVAKAGAALADNLNFSGLSPKFSGVDVNGLQQSRSAGLSEATALRLVQGLENARPQRETTIHQPVTVNASTPAAVQAAINYTGVGRR